MTHRVVVAKIGLDGHDRGARLVARVLRDAGYEVIYTGLFQTPDVVLRIVEDEDVQAVGVSVLSGAHLEIAEDFIKEREARGLGDVPLIMGGIIPEEDVPTLKALGIAEVIPPGATTAEVVEAVNRAISAGTTNQGVVQ